MFAFLTGSPQADDDAAAGKKLYLGADVAENDNDDNDGEDGDEGIDEASSSEEKEDVDQGEEYDEDEGGASEPGPPRMDSGADLESGSPPPLPPTDFDSEMLVTALAELELAKTLLGRREDVLVMFRPSAQLVSRAAFANLKQAALLPVMWLLLPCLVRGAQHQKRVGNAMYYVVTDKGLGSVITRVDVDPWALPRSPGFDKTFIPWDDVVKIGVTGRSETCASMNTVEITFVKPVRGPGTRHSKRPADHIGEPESEKWMVQNPELVAEQLGEYLERFSSDGAKGGVNMRHASLESLRSIKQMVDALLPEGERDPKRLFVAQMSDPDEAVIITLPPSTSWASFLSIVEGALQHSIGSRPRIYVLKDGAHAHVTDVHTLMHDDLVLVEV